MTTPTKSSDSSSSSTSSPTASGTKTSPATSPETNNVVEMSSAQPDTDAPSAPTAPKARRDDKSSSKLTPLLGVLLLISVGLNFWQSQTQANLETQAGETTVALDRAIERIDLETLRANRAETKISAIDGGVDTVNERILELQAALADLSELTAR